MKELGSCPECGRKIFPNDEIPEEKYRCLFCKWVGTKEELIPF